MHIQRENSSPLTARLTLRIIESDYKPKWESALKDYRKRASIPGFRPGHAPEGLIKKKFGRMLLAQEIDELINKSLHNYLTENKISYLGNPLPLSDSDKSGDWDTPTDFNFEYEIGLSPEFEVTTDNSISRERYLVEMSPEFLDARLKDVARRFGKMSEPEVAESEDMLVGTFIELDAGNNILAGGIMADSTISIEFIKDDATRKSLVGLETGSEVVLDPHKVSQSHDDLGRMLNISHAQVHDLVGNFLFRVKEVKRLDPAEMDQNLYDRVLGKGVAADENSFRGFVQADLERRFARESDMAFDRQLVESIIDGVNIPLPDSFLKRWMLASGNTEATAEELERDYPQYARALRWQLIEQKVMAEHNIRIIESDLIAHAKASIGSQYARYGIPMDDDQLTPLAENALREQKDRKQIVEAVLERKVVEALRSNVTIKDVYIAHEDFVKKTTPHHHHH